MIEQLLSAVIEETRRHFLAMSVDERKWCCAQLQTMIDELGQDSTHFLERELDWNKEHMNDPVTGDERLN
jgi:hypothetical protein